MSTSSMDDSPFLCPTCLDVFVDPVTVAPCGHSFCCHCLCKWLDGTATTAPSTRCPLCGQPIVHATLSYSLRAAVEAAHAHDVSERRAALGNPAAAHFNRAIHVPRRQHLLHKSFFVVTLLAFEVACVVAWWAADYSLQAVMAVGAEANQPMPPMNCEWLVTNPVDPLTTPGSGQPDASLHGSRALLIHPPHSPSPFALPSCSPHLPSPAQTSRHQGQWR